MKTNTTTTRGSIGAAHLGPASGFRWGRAPLLSPEDGTGSGAGVTGGESTTTTTTTAATGEPGTAPAGTGEKLIPQSQVNHLVAKARQEGRDAALKEKPQGGGQQPSGNGQPAAKGDSTGMMSAEDVQQLIARDRAFTRATAQAGLSDRQLERMEAALRVENPSDVATWARSYLEDMGLVKSQITTTTTTTNNGGTTDPTRTAPAAPNAPTKIEIPTVSGLVDIWNLSADQIDQLGPEGIRAEHEKILAAAGKRAGAPPVPKVLQKR